MYVPVLHFQKTVEVSMAIPQERTSERILEAIEVDPVRQMHEQIREVVKIMQLKPMRRTEELNRRRGHSTVSRGDRGTCAEQTTRESESHERADRGRAHSTESGGNLRGDEVRSTRAHFRAQV